MFCKSDVVIKLTLCRENEGVSFYFSTIFCLENGKIIHNYHFSPILPCTTLWTDEKPIAFKCCHNLRGCSCNVFISNDFCYIMSQISHWV